MAGNYRLIGKDFTPPDVYGKVTGQARYAEDFRAEGMLFAKLLLSPMPHGRVRRLDVSRAQRMNGVVAILTPDDVPQVPPGQEPILAREPMYMGEPIAAVAAVDEVTAAAAVEAIQLDMQLLPFVTDPLDSLRPGGPDASTAGNVFYEGVRRLKWTARDFAAAGDSQLPMGEAAVEWSYGDVEAGFREAALVLDETFVTQANAHHSMEPRSAMAYWQNGKCYLHASLQSVANAAPGIARILGIRLEDLVLISENTGGGFGSKAAGYPQLAIPALLSRKAGGRPVMMRVTRLEEFYFGRCRAGFQGRVRIGFRADGRITALDLYLVQSNGPYSGYPDYSSAANAVSIVYQPLAMRFRAVPVLTNTPPRSPQRGPGENQIAAALEPILDKAARQLGLDRVAIRRVNVPSHDGRIGADQGPITSSYLPEALDIGAERFGWAEKKQLSRTRRGSKVTGVGVGMAYHSAGANGFDGLVVIKPDGKVYIHSGEGNLGTFSYVGTARVAAEVLGVPWEQCEVVWGSTARHLPWTSVQAGSNTSFTMSRAKYAAAMDARRKLQEIAAMDLGGSPDEYEVADGRVYHPSDPSRGMTLARAAERAIELGGKYAGYELPPDLNEMTVRSAQAVAGSGLVGVARDNLERRGTVPAFGVGFVRVEVDIETGKVDIVEYLGVADCGTVIHPMSLGTQVCGGAVQGFGLALFEKHVFDTHLGWPATRRLYTSKPPSYLDVPLDMQWAAVDQPDPQNPVGAKGVGEPLMGAAAAAVACAIADALGGHYFNRIPITPDMVLNAAENRPQSYRPLEVNV
ncbi:MAG: xanthine dehydrogenase family protein molybdopterin-binding subunit [Bacillota bacterium]